MGDLKYTNSEGVLVDCTLAVSGDCVPLDVVEMNTIATSAKFVLVVEKDGDDYSEGGAMAWADS